MNKNIKLFIFIITGALVLLMINSSTLYAKSDDPFAKELKKDDSSKKKVLTEEDIYDLKREINSLIKRKQFETALEKMEDIPIKALTKNEKKTKQFLLFFKTIDQEIEEAGSMFGSDEELDEYTKRTIKRLYREAQTAYMQSKNNITKDLLKHILFLHRQNAKSKKFMENAYDLKVGSYKVENVEEKYWREIDTYFYGGNYSKAIESANILTFFDRENPTIYQKMGSAHYMMANRKKAVESWKTALFLKGGKDATLEKYISETNKLILEDEAKARSRAEERKKRTAAEESVQGEMKLMGVFNTQQKAYNFAGDLKKQGKKVVVEEMDNGKFSVKIPKDKKQKK
jgi:predicted Zn-dependent protease